MPDKLHGIARDIKGRKRNTVWLNNADLDLGDLLPFEPQS